MQSRKALFLYSDIFRNSVYGDNHPLNIARVWPCFDICRYEGWVTQEEIMTVSPATPQMLSAYHDEAYIAALYRAEKDQFLPEDLRQKYNIGQSGNPIFKEVYRRPATAAHASLIGARKLVTGQADIVYNPSGGTHHGRKAEAFGFCFVNDPALAIDEIRTHSQGKICYLDIDAHHCDGVQDWHRDTQNLRLFSIHQDNLWPRTGACHDGHAHNFLLAEGAGDAAFLGMLTDIIAEIRRQNPAYVILQAGSDGHRDDPQSKLYLSLSGYWQAVRQVLSLQVPTMILGGGGYNPYITAKAWAGNWALIKGIEPHHHVLSEPSLNVLKGLSWHHRLGRNPPAHWFSSMGDKLT